MMQLENETADITHHFYLGKCNCTVEKTLISLLLHTSSIMILCMLKNSLACYCCARLVKSVVILQCHGIVDFSEFT